MLITSTRMSYTTPTAPTVVFVHGLNTSPDIFKGWEKSYKRKGFNTVTVALTGHRGQSEELETLKEGQWESEVREAFDLIPRETEFVNIYSFSMGSVLAMKTLLESHDLLPKLKCFNMFSPGFFVKGFVNMLYKTNSLLSDKTKLPSLAPVEVRANPNVPLIALREYFRITEDVEKLLQREKLMELPIKLYINSKDEVIDVARTKKLFNAFADYNSAWYSIESPYKFKHFSLPKTPELLDVLIVEEELDEYQLQFN